MSHVTLKGLLSLLCWYDTDYRIMSCCLHQLNFIVAGLVLDWYQPSLFRYDNNKNPKTGFTVTRLKSILGTATEKAVKYIDNIYRCIFHVIYLSKDQIFLYIPS